jgi:hypothetical protein
MPDGIEIDYSGVNRVANWLRGLAAALPHAVNEEVEEWGKQDAVPGLQAEPYPPQHANSSYVRTYQLQRAWALKKQSGGQFSIVNMARSRGRLYAHWVVGLQQAWMHLGRWWQAVRVLTRFTPRLRQRILHRIDRETRA